MSVQAFARALERASSASKLDELDRSEVTAPLRAYSASPFASFSDKTPRRIFLSASPADDAFAARLEADLEARGVPIVRGRDTSDEHNTSDSYREEIIRQAIRAADIALVVISPNTRTSRTVQEQLRITGMYERRLVFVWASGDDLATLIPEAWGKSALVDLVDEGEARYQLALEEIVARLSQGSFSTEPVRTDKPSVGGIHATLQSEPRNPYKGLRAFTYQDSADFFGRDTLIQELAQTTQHMLASPQPGTWASRLLAVVGPSGSGKSSVVMAGLLPQLSKGLLPGSEHWEFLESMVPEKHPLESLALTLAPHLPNRSLKTIREDLEDDSRRGLHLLAIQMEKHLGAKVVLTIDQFEEVFASAIPEVERQKFIDVLVTAATEPRGPIIIILTLRADFYDRPLSYPALAQLIEQHHHIVLPMDISDLRAIIEQPAALPDVQLTFEGNLVGDMLFDAQGQAGALPLLEFTLDQLFQRREGHWLTSQAYQQIGRVKGALAKQAESTYASLPSEEHRRLSRALFLRLIDPGVTEQDTTRRRAQLSELSLPEPEQTKIMREAVDAFVTARLLTTNVIEGTTTIEVSHEALIREWARLSGWLREAREDIHHQQAISADAAEWERRGRPEDRVYSGTELAEAQAWAERNVPSVEELAFLKASVAEHERKEKLEQSRQERELKLKRQTVNRLRGLVAVLSLFLAASIVFATIIEISLSQNIQLQQQTDLARQNALAELQIARSDTLVADAKQALSNNQLDQALLLSVKATQTNTFEARNGLLSALENSPQIVTMLRSGSSIPLLYLAFASDGHTLVSADNASAYRWNTASKQDNLLHLDMQNYLGAVALSPDGQTLATSSAVGVRLWDSTTGSMLASLEGMLPGLPPGIEPGTAIAFSADGKYLAYGRCGTYAPDMTCLETAIFIRDVASNKLIVGPLSVTAGLNSLAFSPDGTILASGSTIGVQLWSTATGHALNSLPSNTVGSNSVAFNPAGTMLASGGKDGMVRLWNMASGQFAGPPTILAGHTGPITDVAFSPDAQSQILASSSEDTTVRLWNTSSTQSFLTLHGDPEQKWSVAFAPDGKTLASGSGNGTIILWNITAQSVISQQLANTGGLRSPVFSPDGTIIYTGSGDGKILLRDARTGQPVNMFDTTIYPASALPGKTGQSPFSIESLALSKDGRILASARLDGTIILWNIKTGKPLRQFGKPGLLFRIALSSNGQILAASSDGDTITLWNAATGTLLHILPYHTDKPFSSLPIALSPDGKLLAVGSCGKLDTSGSCIQGQVQLWDVTTGKSMSHPLLGHTFTISDVAFSPDGHTLASSSHDGIILWDVATGKPRGPMLAIPTDSFDYYSNLLFSPDGKTLASASGLDAPQLGFVLWNVQQQQAIANPIQEGDSVLRSIAFSPNGEQLALVSLLKQPPNTVILSLWDVSIKSWQIDACTIANRNLTKDEWQQFISYEHYGPVCLNLAA